MHILRNLRTLTLFFALTATSLYGQASYSPEYEDYGDSAYRQGSQVAHWSAYVPIGALVAAGIFLGIADKKHKGSNSHASDNGLGCLKSYSGYSGYSSHSGRYSTTGYSH